MKIGDPMDEDTRVGATISKNHSEKVLGYIDSAVEEVFVELAGLFMIYDLFIYMKIGSGDFMRRKTCPSTGSIGKRILPVTLHLR